MKKVWSWLESNRGPIFHNLTLLTIRPPYALITLNFVNILIRKEEIFNQICPKQI